MKMKKAPLYISIMEIIKERIIDGQYPLHSLIPTENELEEEFQVSKITIRNAIELLESDGYVSKQSGKGTTVVSNAIFNKLSKGETFTKVLQKQGYQLRKENTTITTYEVSPQHELYPYFGSKATKITRMYYLDGSPYIYYTYYLPSDVTFSQQQDDEQISIYMELYKHHYYVKAFRDEFNVSYPSQPIAQALACVGEPLLGRKRITINEHDQVIEVSYAYYNTKRHPYMIEFSV